MKLGIVYTSTTPELIECVNEEIRKKSKVKNNEDKTTDKKEYKSKDTVYRCFWLFADKDWVCG